MSSARDHALGGVTLPRGGSDAIAAGINVLSTGATATGGAEFVHARPLGQDGHEGILPSGDKQQSTPPIVGRGFIDGVSLDGACLDSSSATS